MKESQVKEPSLRTERSDILERTFDFSVRVIKFYQKMEKTEVNRILGRQLLSAATSVGANVHEAQGGQSKADFIAKVSIAQKECLETLYWLRLCEKTVCIADEEMCGLLDEAGQLAKILSSILISSKRSL